jgi:hypothetical protein
MTENVNDMLIESVRKKGCLCASEMKFNATTINNYMALFIIHVQVLGKKYCLFESGYRVSTYCTHD